MKLSIQSLQFRRQNKSGRKTLRQVWDVVSRDDSPMRLLIETWGGKPDGYIKCFATDLILGNYLSKRIAKTAQGAADEDVDLSLIGAEEYIVNNRPSNLDRAMESENHENAKLRLKIGGARGDWDDDTCLNKTMYGIVNIDDESVSANDIVQAMASRVKLAFKPRGSYHEQLISIHEFMDAPGGGYDDVLATGEDMVYEPMDRERIAEVIQLADGLRTKMGTWVSESKAPNPEIHTPEPEVIRGTEWGGWA